MGEARTAAPQLVTAIYGLWTSAVGSGQLIAGRQLSDRLLRLTASGADEGLRLQAHHSAWTTSLFAGDPAATCAHCEVGRRLYDPERHRSHRLLYGRAQFQELMPIVVVARQPRGIQAQHQPRLRKGTG
jgi:hypothetical protein